MSFKVGDNVRIVRNADPKGFPMKSRYIGETFTITKMAKDYPRGTGIWDSSKTDNVCYFAWYEDELVPEFAVGSKVTLVDNNDALWLHNGAMESVAIGSDTVFKVTDVSEELQRIIIVSLDTSNTYFVNQRFLKECVATPKFKRGDFVEYDNGYLRILKVNTGNSKVTYDITSVPSKYNNEEQAYYKGITEDNLKEVQ